MLRNSFAMLVVLAAVVALAPLAAMAQSSSRPHHADADARRAA